MKNCPLANTSYVPCEVVDRIIKPDLILYLGCLFTPEQLEYYKIKELELYKMKDKVNE